MQASFLVLLLSSLIVGVIAQDVDRDDYPTRCNGVCDPVRSITDGCEKSTDDDNDNNGQDDNDSKNYINCVCNAPQHSQIPLCAACISQYGGRAFDGDDVNELMVSCTFSTTSFTDTSATATDSMIMTETSSASITNIVTSVESAATSATGAIGSSISSALSSAAQSLSSAASSATAAPGAAASPVQPNAVGVVGVVVAAVLAAVGLM